MACSLPRLQSNGCIHYKRKAEIVAPCCGKTYTCRFCHDEKENDHKLNRRSIREIMCSLCEKKQPFNKHCKYCGIIFGRYFCNICHLFDDEDKGQFHCEECGICRVGHRNRYFHCKVCNLCLSKQLENNHKCVENASRNTCAICVEDLHTSREECFVPKCMHMLHKKCKELLESNGHTKCPQCDKDLREHQPINQHINKWVF